MLMMTTSTFFHFTNSKYHLRTEAQQAILMRDDQSFDLAVNQHVEQPQQPFLAIVHAGPKVRYDLVSPAVTRTKKFEHLLLPLKIAFLIRTRYSGVGYGSFAWHFSGKTTRQPHELRYIIPTMSGTGAIRVQLALRIPSPKGRNGDPKSSRSFSDAYKPTHFGNK